MWRKRLQLGLIHTAVAITLVPFTSTLNRVMIYEMGLAATVVTLLVALPYFFSPIQVAIGSYADRNPIAGLRRTPYIVLGLLMCVGGAFLAPLAVAMVDAQGWTWLALALSAVAFGAWGMGYNFAAVSYLSLASEIDEQGRSRTISTMFFMMIVGIIATAATVGHIVDPYSLEALRRAFWTVGAAALGIGLLGLIALEPRTDSAAPAEERHTWGQMLRAVTGNPQARLFFVYLVILLAALLGQDVLLEPFGGQALGLSVEATTRITSIWGTCMLVALVAAGWLQVRFSKRSVALVGAWVALAGFVAIAGSGLAASRGLFYGGIMALGLGTGLSTVANLSLMLDMTAPHNVGLYIGAWGMANAISRLVGQLMSGAVRDALTGLLSNPTYGYVVVFLVEASFILLSLLMLRRVDVAAFREAAPGQPMSLVERAALVGEAGD
jgi:BCD family chlorophyll transporter-like MFS transporter